jgi:hypothetical protein
VGQQQYCFRKGIIVPRTKVNKAAKIRETFARLGAAARPKDVIAELAGHKIEVSSAQVSNVKATMNGHRKNGHGRPAKSGTVSITELFEAKKLTDSLGSIERAQGALAALAKLQ